MANDAAADDETAEVENPKKPKDAMVSISDQMTKLSTGDRAALRRIYLTKRHEADGVVIGLLHGANVPIPPPTEAFAPWRLLAHVAALLSGTAGNPPHAKYGLGKALYDADYSESRVLRLTAARGPALHDQIIRAARVIAQKRKGPVDLWHVLHLAGQCPLKAEKARLQIAHDYYAAAVRPKGDSK